LIAAAAARITGARAIDNDQPEFRKRFEQPVPELQQLGAEPVQEEDRRALADVDIVEEITVDVDEPACRRHPPLGLGSDPPCGIGEIAGDEAGGRERRDGKPDQQLQDRRAQSNHPTAGRQLRADCRRGKSAAALAEPRDRPAGPTGTLYGCAPRCHI